MHDQESKLLHRDGFDQRLLRHKVLSRTEEHKLAVKMRAGDQRAANQLLLHNLKLIAKYASHYAPAAHSLGFADLLMVGIAVFIENLPNFDPAKGCRISTYMTWWIRHAMRRAMDNEDRLVRFPVHVLEKVRQMDDPTPLRTASKHRLKKQRSGRVAHREEMRLLRAMVRSRTISLDAPLNDEPETGSLTDLLNTDKLIEQVLITPPPDAGISHDLMAQRLSEQMAELPRQQRAVLECRFWKGMTLDQTADYLFKRQVITNQGPKKGQPVCRERIRQIQEQALATLRQRLPDLQ